MSDKHARGLKAGLQASSWSRERGFADEQNLRRAFRKIVGVVPNEYRARFGA